MIDRDRPTRRPAVTGPGRRCVHGLSAEIRRAVPAGGHAPRGRRHAELQALCRLDASGVSRRLRPARRLRRQRSPMSRSRRSLQRLLRWRADRLKGGCATFETRRPGDARKERIHERNERIPRGHRGHPQARAAASPRGGRDAQLRRRREGGDRPPEPRRRDRDRGFAAHRLIARRPSARPTSRVRARPRRRPRPRRRS